MGDTYERELVNLARERGYGAMRTPSSGRGNDVDLPDLMLYSSNCGVLAIEHKYTTSGVISFDSEGDIEAVKSFAGRWDATPCLVVRFAYDTTHYVIEVSDECRHYQEMLTRTGNIRPREEDTDDYRDVFELLKKEPQPLVV